MKKLMLIATVLMIAGGISAHGYGYYHGYGCRGPVVIGRPYIAPYIAVRAPVYYGGGYGYGYRPRVLYRGGYYRGYRR